MANNAAALPKYFSQLTTLRFFASGFFLATAVRLGGAANSIGNDKALFVLESGQIGESHQRLLRAAFTVEAVVAVLATLWAWLNVLGEASERLRKSALKGCWRSDLTVLIVSVASIIMQKVAVMGSRCIRPVDFATDGMESRFDTWCSRFETHFRFTVAMLILAGIPLFFSSRWLVHQRLTQARAVSGDWSKNHSDRLRPYLAFLQILAAPVRFFWRCCCKLGHSTRNPTAWATLYGLFAIPVLFAYAIIFLMSLVKSARRLVKERILGNKRDSKPDGGQFTFHHGTDLASPAPPEFGPSIALGSPDDNRQEARQSFKERMRKRKDAHHPPSPVHSTLLDDLFREPDVFFEVLSHLHGADLRSLSTVSHKVRSHILDHRHKYRKAMRLYICSRASASTEQVSVLARPDPVAPVSAVNSPTSTDLQDIAQISTQYGSYPCWSCGVVVCPSCSQDKEHLRVSKAEIRLHALHPVCSLCYFACLCGPHSRNPVKSWLNRHDRKADAISRDRRVFRSISTKCQCTSEKPPKMTHALCRDCHQLGMSRMWQQRMRRGAIADADELPPHVAMPISETFPSDEDNDEPNAGSTASEDDEDVEATAGVEQAHTKDTEPEPDPPPRTGSDRPVLATRINHCYSCHERLWILPAWLGFGTTRGLRWWRCRQCGLEARDVMMSLRREFL